jgi:hypothetical protein
MRTTRRVFFTMVMHPVSGWTRVGNAYPSKESAQDWVPFVRRAWRGLRTRVAQCTLSFENGVLSERSRSVLDQKFNLDAVVPGDTGIGQ